MLFTLMHYFCICASPQTVHALSLVSMSVTVCIGLQGHQQGSGSGGRES